MKTTALAFAALASLTLTACGDEDPTTSASEAAANRDHSDLPAKLYSTFYPSPVPTPTESMRTFEDLEAEVEAEENAPPEVGFDEEADAWTEESGLVIHAPDYYGEDTLNPKVENASSSVLTPYFQIRFFNKGGDFLITSWDCYGDALDPGQSQRVECFGEGTYKAGVISIRDESVPY